MTNPLDTLDRLAGTPGKLDKAAILRNEDTPELRRLLVLAVSPYVNFGVGKLPEIVPAEISGKTVHDFFELTDKLARRELTGNAAKFTIHEFLSSCDAQQVKHFGGILVKKLRCGVDSTVTDVWPGIIPEWKPMLAESWEDFEKKPKAAAKWCTWPKLASKKLDGMRYEALWLEEDNTWVLRSREGRPIESMPHIIEDLNRYGDKNLVYDGELYSHDVILQKGFPYLIGMLKCQSWDISEAKKSEIAKMTERLRWRSLIKAMMFDAVPRADWDAMQNSETQVARLNRLKKDVFRMQEAGATSIEYVDHVVINDFETFKEYNQQNLTEGFEGSMLKSLDGFYKFGRGAEWLKFKTFMDQEFEITGFYEGEGKWAGTLGGFTMVTDEGIPFKCGGGRISKEERDELWEQREELICKKATVRFFELSPDRVPRLPTFYALRDYE